MKNLGISLFVLFIVSLGSVSAAPLLDSSCATSISGEGEKCCKKKKKKCKKDKESCEGKQKTTEEETK